ncbi:hypothetical protein LTR78_001500 [Recurvomyces mirabilis]|uniref:Uncharacterized protein n=1 Tax=Recurvomyces mirabilis TaxID=574656 RepID=A0AAE0WWG1_9PEZI|nr:hypothetical protein LTR78_001500 [Recurvomyces mirabilis]KAK5161479.1 hypothetical protein LTS14_001275 [Recurvomyces mirabilis]
MPRNLSVVEPHPSYVRQSSYIGSGRGGAGNYARYQSNEISTGPDASGPAARLNMTKPARRPMVGGRGGAGNMFTPSAPEETMFQFDEEMASRRAHVAPTYHIGRGGAANWIDESKPRGVERKTSTDSAASIHSDKSTASSVRRSIGSAFGQLQRRVSKQ